MAKELSFSLGIGASPLSEIEDQEVYTELARIIQAINVLAYQLDTATGSIAAPVSDRPYILPVNASKEANMCRGYAEATVDFAPGELLSINSAGKAVKAQATGTHTTKARGIVLASTSSGAYVPYVFRGIVKLFAGLTAGTDYYLSTTAGGITLSVPAAGNTLQFIGFPLSPTEFYFCPDIRHSVT